MWARGERDRYCLCSGLDEHVPQSLSLWASESTKTGTAKKVQSLNAIRLTWKLEEQSQVVNAGKSAPWNVEYKIWNDVGVPSRVVRNLRFLPSVYHIGSRPYCEHVLNVFAPVLSTFSRTEQQTAPASLGALLRTLSQSGPSDI